MAIKGGNPLVRVEGTMNGNGFVGKIVLPGTGEELEQEFGRDHVLYDEFAMFGWETRTRNTIQAVPADKRTPELARQRALDLTAAYDDGKGTIGREAGEGTSLGGYTARAIAEVKGRTVAEVINHVKGQFETVEDEKKRKAAIKDAWEGLALHEDFAPVVKRMKEEAAAARAAKHDPKKHASLLKGL